MKTLKENSAALTGVWEPGVSIDVHTHVQTKLRITRFRHKSTIADLMLLPDHDDPKSDEEFVTDFMRAVGDHLSPHQLELLMRAFSKELTAWAKRSGSEESLEGVFSLYEQLLEEAAKA